MAQNFLIEEDLASIWHPFTQMQTAAPPIPIVRGEGAWLFAANGKKILDMISSWWVNLHGHCHPYIVRRIQEQLSRLEQVIFADFTHPPAIELAQNLLCHLKGDMAKVFYSDNGSTAVEVAIKMALQYWYNRGEAKKRIICFKNSYHGDTFGAMSVAGKNGFNRPFWSHLFDVVCINSPVKGKEESCYSQMSQALQGGDVAAFIFEPLILGAGGMVIYPARALDHLIVLARKENALIIADEVMTGFGRTGTLFATHQLTSKVDLIALAKGITGGFLPMGATTCTQEIYDAFLGPDRHCAFLHGHSYTANPLACAAGVASLELLLESRCVDQREKIADSHKKFCKKVQAHPKIYRCETLGTIFVLEYKSQEEQGYFHSIRDRLCTSFLDKGVLVRPLGNVLYLMPPYCIREEELQYVYDLIMDTLEKI